VNNQKLHNSFNDYLNELIQQQYLTLESATEQLLISRTQGKIAAYRRLMFLREEVNNGK
jgi:hypothetical protein